jgi:hypothetical protein
LISTSGGSLHRSLHQSFSGRSLERKEALQLKMVASGIKMEGSIQFLP